VAEWPWDARPSGGWGRRPGGEPPVGAPVPPGLAVDQTRPDPAGAGTGTGPAEPPAASGSTEPRAGTDPATARSYFGLRRHHLAGLVCALAMVAAGPVLGLIWAALAPRLDVAAGIGGSEIAFSVQSDIDAYFAAVCAVAGLIGGALACWRAASAGWPVPVGLALGGLGGSLLAGLVGHLRRSPQVLKALPDNAGPVVTDIVDMKVRSTGLYLVLPVSALLVLTVLLWLSSLRGGPRR
jgi:hypothetical protein